MRFDQLAAARCEREMVPYAIEVHCAGLHRDRKPWALGQFELEPPHPADPPMFPIASPERAWHLSDRGAPNEVTGFRRRRNLRKITRSTVWIAADGRYIGHLADYGHFGTKKPLESGILDGAYQVVTLECGACRSKFVRRVEPLWAKLDQLATNCVVALSITELSASFIIELR